MKQLIKDVLEDMSTGQINLESEASRELIANTIIANIKTNNGRKGWFLDLSTLDGGSKLDTPIYEKSVEQKARETWVCSICGKNTYDVDWDYIGSDTNHLGCELELEMKSDKRVTEDRRKSDRREKKEVLEPRVVDDAGVDIKTGKYVGDSGVKQEAVQTLDDGGGITYREKNWLQKNHEDKVFGKESLQKQAYMEMTADGLPEGGDSQAVRDSKMWVDKLTEEIVTDNDTGYIYESPDGGKTVYKRKEGSDKRELVKDWKK